MDLEKKWIQEFKASLIKCAIPFTAQGDAVIYLNNQQIIRLVSLDNIPDSSSFTNEGSKLEAAGYRVYNLWEDVWRLKPNQVLSRLLYFSNLSERVHARKCKIKRLDSIEFKEFLNANHLQGSVSCKFKYGLVYKDSLIAVAGFNQLSMPSRGVDYKSSELLRYCTLSGINISGGLSKLLMAHFKSDGFDDLMSYADKDWSSGVGYKSLNFNLIGETPKVKLYLYLRTFERYSEPKFRKVIKNLPSEIETSFIEVFNSGNLKFVLKSEQFK